MIHNPEIFNSCWPRIQFALDPKQIIFNEPRLKTFFDSDKGNYTMIAIGKGSSAFASAIFEVFYPTKKYICLDNYNHASNLKTNLCDHPMPTKRNLAALNKAVKFIKSLDSKTPILTIITGGSSAMLCNPTNSLKRSQSVYSQLLTSGISIEKINTVRKHSDLLKGGNLTKLYYPRKSLNLYVSDVDNDDISIIGSGPTVLDLTTLDDAELILKQQKIKDFMLAETPKNSKYFCDSKNKIIYTREQMLANLAKLSNQNVFMDDKLLSSDINNATSEIIKKLNCNESTYLFAGEPRIKVSGHGKGGRCAHLALLLLSQVKDCHPMDIISFATDGFDNSNYAGVAFNTLELFKLTSPNEIKKYLSDFDSYTFFEKYYCTIKTGPLPVNMSDLLIISTKFNRNS